MSKKVRVVLPIIIGITLLITSVSAGTIESNQTDEETIPNCLSLETVTPQVMDVTVQPMTSHFLAMGADNQVTLLDNDESHPSIGTTSIGNPFIVYDFEVDFTSSYLGMGLSPDKGESWPEENSWIWELEDTYAINPEISFMTDGTRAFGTHETGEQIPTVFLHDYVDINDYTTWGLYSLDFSDTSSYVKETSLTTKGDDSIAIGTICDFSAQDLQLTDTIVINWNTNLGEDSWPGVIWINDDGEGGSNPYSHICSDAGEERVFFVFERSVDNQKSIYCSYVDMDENTIYSDWNMKRVASSVGNCSNPDISVSGSNIYVVYTDDRSGDENVYCATSSTGATWRKILVANSVDDETFPVISADGDTATCLFIKNGDIYKTTTEDFGVTWTEPQQVNDESGTVVEEFESMDIDGTYATWADTRNGNEDIYFEEVGLSSLISIETAKGGFGFQMNIKNIGNAPAEEVEWSIMFENGVFVGAQKEGSISMLDVGESVQVKTGFILGFGSVVISVTAGATSQSYTAFVLGPFVLGLE